MSVVLAGAAYAQSPPPLRKLTLENGIPDAKGIKRLAILRGLDKITGRATDIAAPAGVPVRYGSLLVTVRYCYTRPPEEPPETTAYLQIDDVRPGQDPTRVFSGWMFASTPALHALEHPVYDVWVITCKTNAPAPAMPAAAPAPAAPKPAAPAPAAAPRAAPADEPQPEPESNP
jgi:hypothetical protein